MLVSIEIDPEIAVPDVMAIVKSVTIDQGMPVVNSNMRARFKQRRS
jgi:hypothetical protein